MTTPPLAAAGAITRLEIADAMSHTGIVQLAAGQSVSFSQLFLDGVDEVSRKANEADAVVKSFVLDDSVPPHQVMYALEQSQLALQMMIQVRNRLVDGYQDIMRMQL